MLRFLRSSGRLLFRFVLLGSPALLAQTWPIDPAFAPQLLDDSVAASTVRLLPLGDGRMLAQGQFDFVSGAPALTGFVRLRDDGTVDAALATLPIDLREVHGLTVLPDGRLFGVGSFYTPSGYESRTFRLLADGTMDLSYAPVEMPVVYAPVHLFSLPSGQVLAAGSFATVGGVSRARLARFHGDGTFDVSFAPDLGSPSAVVRAVGVVPDGKLLVAAHVVTDAPGGEHRLWRLLPNGARDSTFAPPALTRDCVVVAPQADGRVLVDGYAAPLTRLTADGSIDPSFVWAPSNNERARRALVLPNGRVAVETFGGTVQLLESNGKLVADTRTLIGGDSQVASLVAAEGDAVIISHAPAIPVVVSAAPVVEVGGAVLHYPFPLPRSTLRRLRADGTLDPSFSLRFAQAGRADHVAVDFAGRILVAGRFSSVDGVQRPGLARLTANGALDPTFAPALPLGTTYSSLLPAPGGKVLVRSFSSYDLPLSGIIAPPSLSAWRQLRDDGSRDSGFALSEDLVDAALYGFDEDGYLLGGAFVTAEGQRDFRLIRFNSDGSRRVVLPTVFSESNRIGLWTPPAPVDAVQSLGNGRLLVAGGFGKVNGVVRPSLARLNADGTIDPTYAPPLASLSDARPIASLLRQGRALWSAPFEASIPSGPYPNMASNRWRTLRLAPDGTIDSSFSAQFSPPIAPAPLAEQADGALIFSTFRLRTDGSRDRNFAPNLAGGHILAAAALADGQLILAGSFRSIDGEIRPGLARLVPTEVNGITVPPRSQSVVAGRGATFEAAHGTTGSATFQWTHNGAPIPGANDATLTLEQVGPSHVGEYRAVVTLGGETFVSEPATLTLLANTSRLVNFSVRSRAGGTPREQIAGFVAHGSAPRQVLLRATGRGLPFNLGAQTLPIPVLRLHDERGFVAENRGGATTPEIIELARRVGAFPVTTLPFWPDVIHGSALAPTLGSGRFTMITTSGDGDSGLSLFEIYDAGGLAAPPFLRNLSARGWSAPGPEVLTAGFVILGNGPLKLLIRGIGPALTGFNVAHAIGDPQLSVYGSESAAALARDLEGAADDPSVAAAARRSGAFAVPANGRDAGLVVRLEPGAYTVQLGSATGIGGAGLIEVYVLDE